MWRCGVLNGVENAVVVVSKAETGDDDVDGWNEEHDDEDDIVENFSSSLLMLVVDVNCSDDQQQNASYHLKLILKSVNILIFYSFLNFVVLFLQLIDSDLDY